MSLVQFTINGEEFKVSNDVPSSTSLNSYLRNHANLRGTKAMCHEGGCGACIVTVAALHPVTQKPHVFSVNSCLVSILSCHGWSITTVEGIGSQRDGFHPIQRRLAAFNGTQCGYCSPGWVMNMHSLYEEQKGNMTMREIENSFAGNMCRCTGYRPILDAFKTFSKDCDSKLMKQIDDIEELSGIKMCNKNGLICTKSCSDYSHDKKCCIAGMERPVEEMNLGSDQIVLQTPDCKWFKVYKVSEIFDIFDKEGTDSYMLVDGNTARGIFRTKASKVMIDVSDVSELKSYTVEDRVTLGANITMSDAMKVYQEISQTKLEYKYAGQFFNHMDLVAHVPLRNIGTLAGNLAIKHQHHEFQSDIFVMFETVGATLTIAEKGNKTFDVTMLEFLDTDMKGRIISKINLPPLTENDVFYSYKIMPRAQNAHAHVNAGFLLQFAEDKKTVTKASIVYGGINPEFSHAWNTENYMKGKNIFDKNILKEVLKKLSDELIPDVSPPEPTPLYRKKLAVNLFYKCLLRISPDGTFEKVEKSGGNEFERPVSSGLQDFDTNKAVWPLNKPVAKVEALIQCSGEAKYSNDLPTQPGEVFAAFVLSTVFCGTIDKIDATEALAMQGVIALYTAKDIPGTNTFTPGKVTEFLENKYDEEVLCSEKVLFYGQPVALIVAKTELLANIAAKKVKITYTDIPKRKPIISLRDALQSPELKERLFVEDKFDRKEKGNDVTKVIKGSLDFHSQYHYTLETQTCVCIPTEEGLDIFCATQWMDMMQVAVSRALNITENRINVNIRRLGGGFGAKITRPAQLAVACALAATRLNKPVRLVMSLEDNMAVMGKRFPYACDYEVGVNDDGKIQYLENKFYEDLGCSRNDVETDHTLQTLANCYQADTWSAQGYSILTDTASNIACRSPGTTEAVAMIENIMDHIAVATGKDPLDVRMENIDHKTSVIPELLETIKLSSDYDKRCQDIKQFNKDNIWRKRGMSLVPIRFNFLYWGNFTSMVTIYHDDGTVAISHGGIEMGQGLNTKVAQVCAHILGIPIEMVVIKPNNNFTAPNVMVSGGSLASETCCYATIKACEILLSRLEPIKKQMENPTWVELIQKAHGSMIDLCAHYMSSPDELTPYLVWAITIAEVEVDLLTGNHQVLRVDIIEDTGESLNPQVDVGQVEGGFIMGMGYWTSEKLVYDENTGELLTNRTWNYKPPGVKDIPIDMRVSFRRNAPNPCGVLRSKGTGEPAVNTSIAVVLAIRHALNSARADRGLPSDQWCPIELPCTAENILLAADINVV